MAAPDQYFLGYREDEQNRLQRQAAELAPDSEWLFRRIGVVAGWSVVEIGCGPLGCLELLAEVVGPEGRVIGIERSQDAVARALSHVADNGLTNVEVSQGDGRHTALERDVFDLVTSRLVLVNVPEPEQLVAEAVALARPGGVVAYHEPIWPLITYDPPLPEWDRLYDIMRAYADLNGTDLFIGSRLPRMLREHGLVEIQTNVTVHAYGIDHGRRTLALDFVENLSSRLLEHGLVGEDELLGLKHALGAHLADPDTFVISNLFVQAWGRKP